MKKVKKVSKPRTLEALMMVHGKIGETFYSTKADKDLTAIACYYKRRITTSRLLVINTNEYTKSIGDIVKVMLLS